MTPAAVGVPEIAPVDVSSARPLGTEGEAEKENGPRPPPTDVFVENGVPTVAAVSGAPTTRGFATRMENAADEPVRPSASCTCTTSPSKVPAAVGTPAIDPVPASYERPGASRPDRELA